jgi:protein SCO1/2
MPQNPMIRALVIFLIGLLILLMGAAAYLYFTPSQQVNQASFDSSGSGAGSSVGTDYSLVNQAGERVSRGDFAGSYRLYYFGYTYCPDVCPTSLIVMGQAMSLLEKSDPAKAAKIQPLFITIDPERDTPEVLANYVPNFHPHLIGLTGTKAEIDAVAKGFKVYAKKVDERGAGDYLMDHSSAFLLMSPEGEFIRLFTHGTQPQEMAEALAAIVKD